MSDALDRAVAQIDFSALSHQKVHFDTRYIQNTKDPQFIGNVKGLGFVSADYVISSLRQQMVAAGLLLQDKPEEADYIVEARLGAVGTDNNEVIFGIPATNLLSSATMYMPNTPPIPAIPEISLAKRNVLIGAAKIGAFAYHRATRNPVWQAGISKATSTARDTWVLGAGPFQRGTIYEDFQVSGSQLAMPIGAIGLPDAPPETKVEGQVSYYDEFLFGPRPEMPGQGVQPAGLHEPINLQPVPMAPSSAAVPAPQVPTPQINGPAVTAATPVVTNTSEPAKNPAAAASAPSTNPSAK